MNVDAQFPQAPIAALPNRPLQTQADQAAARPVDKADKDEPSNNRTGSDARETEAQEVSRQPESTARGEATFEYENRPAGTFQANSRDTEPVGDLLDVLA